jgi:lantibiotic modifying enzyme
MLDKLAPHPENARVIRTCLDQVSRQLTPESAFVADDLTEESGMDPESGFAHGRAGVVALLLAARSTPHWTEPLEKHLVQLLDLLRVRTSRLVEIAATATAVPLAVSWCRGLAGIGRTLLLAGRQLPDPELGELATAAADACVAWIPYLANRGQCCGISGVGEFFLDLLDDRFDAAANSAATQLVVRGLADPPPKTAVVKLGEQDGIAWSGGIAGELAFLRRLRDRGPASPVGPFAPAAAP